MEKIETLSQFIQTFLPKRGNERKNSGNEIEYVTKTLNRIFSQHFNVPLSREEVLGVFINLGYRIFIRNASWDAEKKTFRPSKEEESVRLGDVYSAYNCGFLYIDINASDVRMLRKASITMPPNTNLELAKQVNDLKDRIQKFNSAHMV